MKKYIAFSTPTNHPGSVQLSKIQTKEAATQWARNQVAKNTNLMGYVCEVVSTVSRPDPVVMVLPFMPESEPEEVKTTAAARLVAES